MRKNLIMIRLLKLRIILLVLNVFLVTHAEASGESTNATTIHYSHGHKYHHHKRKQLLPQQQSVSSLTFDLHYFGEVAGLPQALLMQYAEPLQVLTPIGQRQRIMVNLDLEKVTIADVADALSNQTNGRAMLIYNANDNSVRLSFTGKIDVGQDAVSESLKWQEGENPKPVLKNDGVVRFPYGEYQPVVICQPLNLCDIELQAGEEIQGIVIGDSERWNEGDQGVPVVYSGVGDKQTPHLVLKPSQGGLDTSLMVTTSKRTYMIKLKSREDGYVARAGFYYPGELIQRFENNKEKLRAGVVENPGSTPQSVVKMPLINLSKLNYKYTLKGDDYVWKPIQVFDDGISVYIQLPDGVSSRSLPGICIVPDDDSGSDKCEMVNFRYNEHFYIVDKLFNKAKLINGFGDHAQIVTILRNPDKPGFWARLFGSSNKK